MCCLLEEIDAVVLCGGQGKRLRPVISDRPKVLVQINDKIFLDILINNLLHFGFKRIILSVGYLRDKIIEHFRNKEKKTKYKLIFSKEEIQLGTGGAIKRAARLIKSKTFLVMNGDSFCDMDLRDFLKFHKKRNALISVALTSVKSCSDVGFVSLDESQRILAFSEKQNSCGIKWINAGIYFFDKKVFPYMFDRKTFSLEYDFFPKMVDRQMYGYVVHEELIDIGTPERYKQAQQSRIIGS